MAQLALLETALWPLSGELISSAFETSYSYMVAGGSMRAEVKVRSTLGLQNSDEFVRWGLLVDEAGIRRLFREFSRGVIARWVRMTNAAMHEQPRGFPGINVPPAAVLIDGIQNSRTPPDWLYVHEKNQQCEQYELDKSERSASEQTLRKEYDRVNSPAFHEFSRSPAGQQIYDKKLSDSARLPQGQPMTPATPVKALHAGTNFRAKTRHPYMQATSPSVPTNSNEGSVYGRDARTIGVSGVVVVCRDSA